MTHIVVHEMGVSVAIHLLDVCLHEQENMFHWTISNRGQKFNVVSEDVFFWPSQYGPPII